MEGVLSLEAVHAAIHDAMKLFGLGFFAIPLALAGAAQDSFLSLVVATGLRISFSVAQDRSAKRAAKRSAPSSLERQPPNRQSQTEFQSAMLEGCPRSKLVAVREARPVELDLHSRSWTCKSTDYRRLCAVKHPHVCMHRSRLSQNMASRHW